MQTLKEVNDFFKKQDELQDMKEEAERLRKALQEIADPKGLWLLPNDENPSPAAHKLIVRYRSIARKALKEKD